MPKGCLYACASQFHEKKIVCDFFIKKKKLYHFMHDYVLGFSRKQTFLNLLFNSHVNLNNAMKRIMCNLCVPYALFIGTCWQKKIFFLYKIVDKKLIVRDSKKVLILGEA